MRRHTIESGRFGIDAVVQEYPAGCVDVVKELSSDLRERAFLSPPRIRQQVFAFSAHFECEVTEAIRQGTFDHLRVYCPGEIQALVWKSFMHTSLRLATQLEDGNDYNRQPALPPAISLPALNGPTRSQPALPPANQR